MSRVKCVCKQCGKVFSVTKSSYEHGRGKYCSVDCLSEARGFGKRIKFTCQNCEKEFHLHPYRVKEGRGKYCSQKCAGEAKNKKITCVCDLCGKSFQRIPSAANDKRNNYIYCSDKCARLASRNRLIKTCKYCGDKFEVSVGENNKSTRYYCSRGCAARDRTGERTSNWQGGISFEPYCPKFNREFKERVRDFFNRTCLLCGKHETENDKKLSVHHVFHNKEACCDDSKPYFVTLCTSCHAKVHSKDNMYQHYFENMINNKYGGECYFTKEEHREQ